MEFINLCSFEGPGVSFQQIFWFLQNFQMKVLLLSFLVEGEWLISNYLSVDMLLIIFHQAIYCMQTPFS